MHTILARIDILGVIEKNVVTIICEPSYASSAHMWKGTTMILNKKPTIINKILVKIPLD